MQTTGRGFRRLTRFHADKTRVKKCKFDRFRVWGTLSPAPSSHEFSTVQFPKSEPGRSRRARPWTRRYRAAFRSRVPTRVDPSRLAAIFASRTRHARSTSFASLLVFTHALSRRPRAIAGDGASSNARNALCAHRRLTQHARRDARDSDGEGAIFSTTHFPPSRTCEALNKVSRSREALNKVTQCLTVATLGHATVERR